MVSIPNAIGTRAHREDAATAAQDSSSRRTMHFDKHVAGAVLGPLAAILVWLLPLGIDPLAQRALAVAAFMFVYWLTEPIDHGLTAFIGCFAFWALGIADFSLAFSGFAQTAPWFIFGAILIGEAASQTGIAKRLGYAVLQRIGTSYSRLLLGVIVLSFLTSFIIPSGTARVAVIAPILVGVITLCNLRPGHQTAKGLFIILTYTSGLFDKMILSGASSILARGIVEEQTGIAISWSGWLLAFLPAALLTIFVFWAVIRWLYPGHGEITGKPEARSGHYGPGRVAVVRA
jgi:solute carrier family 13 (sodium-dependent dicarboxylate transporter), member 2/3/5